MALIEVDQWSVESDRPHARIAGRFTRSEPRRRARQYLTGLVAGLDRKNGWPSAEQAGDTSPDGMQLLLRWADWDVDAVRAKCRCSIEGACAVVGRGEVAPRGRHSVGLGGVPSGTGRLPEQAGAPAAVW